VRRTPFLAVLAGCLATVVWGQGWYLVAAGAGADAASIDRAFQEFWAASDPNGASRRIDAIVKSGVSFEDALARIRRGRDYSSSVPRGVQPRRHQTSNGQVHPYTLVIPENYDPTRAYPVRVQLHGGVSRRDPPDAGRTGMDRLPGAVEEIKIFPAAWSQSLWWFSSQVDNLSRILDRAKRTYNIDENQVYLTGISDGGTGVYYMAFRDTTPWASFLPLIGSMTVLANPSVGADGDIYPGNAAGKPFFVVNAGRDRLYPAHTVQPYVEHLRRLGADVVFRVEAESDHNTNWWPEARSAYEAFVGDHPREPLPDRLSWETERTDRYNRAHWLVIDRLGDANGQTDLADGNLLGGREYEFGLRINSNVDRGRRASDVVPGSNAYRIGIRPGDLFIDVNGRPVQTGRDIAVEIEQWELGAAVRLTVERSGKRLTLEGVFEPEEVDMPPQPIFPRRKPSGRVDLSRQGNLVEARTKGVRAFTLLLSPSKFDFNRPIRIVANGRTVFDGRVEPTVETLLKWAARDNDRMMVFGAELHVDLMQ
jgi:hypothetical protein